MTRLTDDPRGQDPASGNARFISRRSYDEWQSRPIIVRKLAFTVPRRFGAIIAGDSNDRCDKTAFSRRLINREIAIDSGRRRAPRRRI